MKRMFFTILTVVAMAVSAFAGPYDAWAKYRTVTVNTTSDQANVAGAVTNFPLLVRLTTANAADVLADDATGASLRFASADGETAYKYVIERWTASAAEVWVRVPSIAGNASTTLRMYWGNGSAPTESSGPDVFQPSNGFLAVYMMNEAAGANLADATGNGNFAVPGSTNPTNNTSAAIGVGKTFAGSANSNFLVTGGAAALDLNTTTGPYSISAWANPTNCTFSSQRGAIVSKYNGTDGQPSAWSLQGSSANNFWRMSNDVGALAGATTNNALNVDGDCAGGTWQMLTGTFDNPSGDTASGRLNLFLYVNRAKSTSIPFRGNANTPGSGASVYIGRVEGGTNRATSRWFGGSIDQIAISNVVRGEDWVQLSYETQKEGVTAVTLGGTVTSLQGFKALGGGMSMQLLGGKIVFHITDARGAAKAGLSIVDVWGRTVWSRTVLPGAGTGQASWDGRTAGGQTASSGLYVARVILMDGENRVLRTVEKQVPFTR